MKLHYFSIILVWAVAGCASARMSDSAGDRLFREGHYEEAAQALEKGAEEQGESGRDVLLYLLDQGLALHSAGKLEESNKVFLRAEQIADIKDYTSLAAETATMVTSDNAKDYKGEDFEKVLINTYLAMNYALMGDNENALVEARKVNRKLHLMVTEGERKYKQNAFARYLSALLYEENEDLNDAYIDYKETYKLEPTFPGLGRDLWRIARILGNREDMRQWDEEFNLTEADHQAALAADTRKKKGKGEIVVLYENGISPIKRANPQWRTLPKFYPRPNPVRLANIEINGKQVGSTAVLHDIESTAIANLDEKYAGLIARKVAGIVVKEVAAKQVENITKSPLAGLLTKVAMYASDQADVRSWNLLPRDLQLARFPVEPGTYTIRTLPVGAGPLGEKTVQVVAGKKTFVNFRYIPQ